MTPLPACEILTKPASYIAAAIWQSIVEQGTTTQMTAFAALSRPSIKSIGYPAIFGDPTCHLMICSNSSKADFLTLTSQLLSQGQVLRVSSARMDWAGHPICKLLGMAVEFAIS
jgi:hypothetical protein